jgi:hypothetical protein
MSKRGTGNPESGLSDLGRGIGLLARAFTEQNACMRAVYAVAAEFVQPPADAPPELAVHLGGIPAAFFTPRRNLFSTLFYSVYLALGVSKPRRMLYGKLNHLFRMWVTSADNLLDAEDKCVLPLEMPGTSRVMREVVAIMAADRVLWRLLNDAVSAQTVTAPQADALARESLRCLLPSAAQEASEEGGIAKRPSPESVLEHVHVFKTGMLFAVPFLGIDVVEDGADGGKVERLRRALKAFGGGCQILDDIRDMARDLVEKRHNYVLSLMARDCPAKLSELASVGAKAGDRLYLRVPRVSLEAARLGYQRLVDACTVLRDEGVLMPRAPVARMAEAMFTALDLEDLRNELRREA